MKKQKVGSRIGRYVLVVLGLALAAMVPGEKGGLTTSVALASEEGRVVASAFPSAPERVSPFLARPILEALLVESAKVALSADCLDGFQYYVNYLTEWTIDTVDMWDCIAGQAYISDIETVSWNWSLLASDGSTQLVSCAAYNVPWWSWNGGGCRSYGYYYLNEYECVGDEQFVLNYQLYGQNWVGPQISYEGPALGCI